MPSSASSARALPIGQILYAIQDTTLIFDFPRQPVTGHYRIRFTGSGQEPRAEQNDWQVFRASNSNFGAFQDIRSARAVTQRGGDQEVVVLTKNGLWFNAVDGGTTDRSHWTPVQGRIDDAVLIIGSDPDQTARRSLTLLHAAGAGFAVVQVDMDSGVRGEPQHLPDQVRGAVVGAELVRRGPFKTIETGKAVSHDAMMMLVVATLEKDTLQVHAVAWEDLTSKVEAKRVKTLSLGGALTVPSAQVAVAVTSMRAGSADQQFAVAWPGTASTAKIALVGWGAGGEATVLATAAPEVSFALPEKPVYRLAAADLVHAGTDQLVLGYTATYGKVKGCAALMLFTLEESASNLKCLSKYAVANTGGQPWSSMDLHLAAGVFGTCIGVQVVGAAASLADLFKGQAFIRFGFVPVDPNLGFPTLARDFPGVPYICADPETGRAAVVETNNLEERIFAFPSDLRGQSVVLGPPTLQSKTSAAQILAILQAPPFDHRIGATFPSISFATGTGQTSSCSVSTDKSWTLSEDVGVNLGLGSLSLSQSTHNSYLKNLSKMKDSSSASNVQFHSAYTDEDFILTYEVGYNIWRYPVLRRSAENAAGGEMLVIIPHETAPQQAWTPAHTYGYRPRSEAGMLLSYKDVQPEGYTAENGLFKGSETGLTVSTDGNTASLTYDKSNSTTDTDSQHFSVLNSVSDHRSITAATDLFEYLPVSFGLNVGSSHSYSDNKVQTTHLTVHSNMTVTVNSGSVKDSSYEYQIFPRIYRHGVLGCLMLTWEVKLTGAAWTNPSQFDSGALTAPQICLIRPVTKSINFLYQSFSRSISFVEHEGGSVTIRVEIFNNSLSPVSDVSCEFFLGQPVKTHKGVTLPEPRLGNVKLEETLMPIQRKSVALKLESQNLTKKPIYVTVQLLMGKIHQGIYWGVYPPETFFGESA